jgi:hypothetical protein
MLPPCSNISWYIQSSIQHIYIYRCQHHMWWYKHACIAFPSTSKQWTYFQTFSLNRPVPFIIFIGVAPTTSLFQVQRRHSSTSLQNGSQARGRNLGWVQVSKRSCITRSSSSLLNSNRLFRSRHEPWLSTEVIENWNLFYDNKLPYVHNQ